MHPSLAPWEPQERADAQCLPGHDQGYPSTLPQPGHLLLNPILSQHTSHHPPCHPAVGAGRVRGWSRLPSPSLSPRSLPPAPATRREIHGQQSVLESPQLCQEPCVWEGKAEPFPAGTWKVRAGSMCPAPRLPQPWTLLLAGPEMVPGTSKPLLVPACPQHGWCSQCQPGQGRFLNPGTQTQLPTHVTGSITTALDKGSAQSKSRGVRGSSCPCQHTKEPQPTRQPQELGRGCRMLHITLATTATSSVPMSQPCPKAKLQDGELEAAADESTQSPAVTRCAKEGQAGP